HAAARAASARQRKLRGPGTGRGSRTELRQPAYCSKDDCCGHFEGVSHCGIWNMFFHHSSPCLSLAQFSLACLRKVTGALSAPLYPPFDARKGAFRDSTAQGEALMPARLRSGNFISAV